MTPLTRLKRYLRSVSGLDALIAVREALQAQQDGLRHAVAARQQEMKKIETLTVPLKGDYYARPARPSMQEYWSRHNVTAHRRFASAEESAEYLDLRNSLYPGYIELMPVAGFDDKVILDYGCGPGNDLVGFSIYSRPRHLIGVDISPPSLEEARERLALHGATAELIHVPYGTYELPIETGSVDYVHCSGVLMYLEDPVRLLREFRRVLRPDGVVRLMVYNYDSIWLHLYVAYVVQLENGLYTDREVREAFSRTTDGEDCPLVQVWNRAEIGAMAAEAGFDARWLGAAVSLWELHILPKRYRAAMDPRLRPESRKFLLELRLDQDGLPVWRGRRAGIDGCYELRPKA
ncbi:MAG: class I SAM-dependent methyltransferase [Rhodospirillaceae bacterium]|nr:class I SAM-dependent methyltransferase [Rhodospirillaceae bacterium]